MNLPLFLDSDVAHIKRAALVALLAAGLSIGAVTPLPAAEPPDMPYVHSPGHDAVVRADGEPAQKCMDDLRDFDRRLQQDGDWLNGSGFGFGYPIYDFGYPEGGILLGNLCTGDYG